MSSPERASGPPGRNSPDLHQQILESLRGKIRIVRVPFAYRLGVLLGAAVILMLPVIYLGIIGLVAYGVYYHVVNHQGILTPSRTGIPNILFAIVYIVPIVIGMILTLFLLKPVLSRPARAPPGPRLDRDDEPLFFDFVDRVCDAVRAPRPARIEFTCYVNAAASLRMGLWSLFRRDLVLTIGMPLVLGLDLRQLAGVLAHEFGHFSQGAGMRFTNAIQTVIHWFARVVYERDAWDERLGKLTLVAPFLGQWIFVLACLFVAVGRRVLWVLMVVAQLIGGLLLRQMELTADRRGIRLAGSDVFESTMRRVALLDTAANGIGFDLEDHRQERQLTDDLPELIVRTADSLPPEFQEQIEQGLLDEGETGLFDTHPSPRERIAAAREERADGLFRLETPAPRIFRDPGGLSRRLTEDFYQLIFGEKFQPEEVRPVEELLVRQEREREVFDALHRYWQGSYAIHRPLPVPGPEVNPTAERQAAVTMLRRARKGIMERASRYENDCSGLDDASEEEREPLEKALREFEELVTQRLFAGLALLPPSPGERAKGLLPSVAALEAQLPAVTSLEESGSRLDDLLTKLTEDRGNPSALTRSLDTRIGTIAGELRAIRSALSGLPYAFECPRGEMPIGDFLLHELPAHDPIEILRASGRMIRAFHRLRARTIAELCWFAEQAEAGVGLERLPDPPEDSRVDGEIPSDAH